MLNNVKEDLIKLINNNPKSSDVSIGDNTNLINDLGFDSIDIMKLIMEIESEFNISFNVDDLDYEKLLRFNNLCNIIDEKLL